MIHHLGSVCSSFKVQDKPRRQSVCNAPTALPSLFSGTCTMWPARSRKSRALSYPGAPALTRGLTGHQQAAQASTEQKITGATLAPTVISQHQTEEDSEGKSQIDEKNHA